MADNRAPVVQRLDDAAIQRVDNYALDKYYQNLLSYPVDNDSCNGYILLSTLWTTGPRKALYSSGIFTIFTDHDANTFCFPFLYFVSNNL